MKTLAGELLELLPEFPAGLTARAAADRLAADYPSVMRAMKALNADGRAWLKRRLDSREIFLERTYKGAGKGHHPRHLPGLHICPNCDEAFRQPKWRRRCCSRKCGIALSWANPDAADKRRAAISASKQTPKAREQLAAHNRRRWAEPEEHAKLAEQNRKQWADPEAKARRSRGIRAAQQKPEQRQLYSEIRAKYWRDPEKRKKMVDGIRRSKQTPEARAKFSALLKARWEDPIWRAKYMASAKRASLKAADVTRGKPQPREQVARRVEATRRTKLRRQSEGAPA